MHRMIPCLQNIFCTFIEKDLEENITVFILEGRMVDGFFFLLSMKISNLSTMLVQWVFPFWFFKKGAQAGLQNYTFLMPDKSDFLGSDRDLFTKHQGSCLGDSSSIALTTA